MLVEGILRKVMRKESRIHPLVVGVIEYLSIGTFENLARLLRGCHGVEVASAE